MVARLQGDEPPGHWRLGVPLPPAEDKRRLGLTAPPSDVLDWRPALHLHEVVTAAPADWHVSLRDLLRRARVLGLEPRVFGSFSWQAMTGLPYVTTDSDLDLAWQPDRDAQLNALLTTLQDWETEHGRRVDGEVLLPDGGGVCWRELAGNTDSVLVKSASAAVLQARDDILDTFATCSGTQDDGAPIPIQTG